VARDDEAANEPVTDLPDASDRIDVLPAPASAGAHPSGLAPVPGRTEEHLSAKAANSLAWMLLGLAALQVGGFGTFVLASNYLSRPEVGLVAGVLTLVFWVDVLLDLGMGAALIYEQEEGQSRRVAVAFTVNTAAAVVVAAGVVLAAPLIAGFFRASDDVGLFRLIALLVLAKGLNQIPDSLLRRDLRFKRKVATDFVRALGRFGIALIMFEAGAGPIAMVVSILVAEWVALVATWYLVRFRPRFAMDRVAAGEMLRYGLAVFGTRLSGMLWFNGDYLVVGNRLGARSKSYADYYTAFRLPEMVLGGVYNIFSSIAFPMYSAAREVSFDKLRTAVLRALKLLCLFGFTAGAGMALVARDFITTAFGSGASGAIAPMQILCASGALVAIGYASGDLFNALGKPKIALQLNLLGAPILIGSLLLVVDQGITAVATVHLIIQVPYTLLRMYIANRMISTTWAQSFGALRSGACAAAGVIAFALPIRLMTDGSFVTGLAIVGAGMLGGVLGLLIGDRKTFGELAHLGRQAVGR